MNLRKPEVGSWACGWFFRFSKDFLTTLNCSRTNLLLEVVRSRKSCSCKCGVQFLLLFSVALSSKRVSYLGFCGSVEDFCWCWSVINNVIWCQLCLVFNSERIFITVWFIFQRTICSQKSYSFFNYMFLNMKGHLSGLRQFLTTESLLVSWTEIWSVNKI